MKAVVYKGPFSVAVEKVPDPELQHPNDVIVKITSSCICGSDLHMYEGWTASYDAGTSIAVGRVVQALELQGLP